jgi:hypothetical protein
MGPTARLWMAKLFTSCLEKGSIPKEWKEAKITAILKPNKQPEDPKSYRPISLLSTMYKLLERVLLRRMKSKVDSKIPMEQAGFREGRNCCDQVLALTTHIEAGFQRGQKTVAAFLDLSAAYDTVWLKALIPKIYETTQCPYTTRLIKSMLSNRSFRVYMGKDISKTFYPRNGLPQGSVLSPLLFIIYTSDLPNTQSRKFIYADDIAITCQDNILENAAETLTQDLKAMEKYFNTWKLKPNPQKTVVTSFHLNNKQAKEEVDVFFAGSRLQNEPNPKYLGVTLDRALTYKKHLQNLRQKAKSRVNILHKLAGTTWGCDAKTLKTAGIGLVYSAAEYCAPVWFQSAHTKIIDTQLNETMRIISGTLKPTPVPWLSVLSNITPPNIRREEAFRHEVLKVIANKNLPIHLDVDNPPKNRLKSRHPYWIAAAESLDSQIEDKWREFWQSSSVKNQDLIQDPTKEQPGFSLPRKLWCKVNRIRCDVGCTASNLHKWGWVDSPSCTCGMVQTIDHLINECPTHAFNGRIQDIHDLTDEAILWLRALDIRL